MADVGGPQGAYWAGDQLVVAGGVRTTLGASDAALISPTAEALAFDPQSGQWRDIGPLPTEGHDGLLPFAGAWTGSELIVLGTACNEHVENDNSECATSMALTWNSQDGWESVELPPVDTLGNAFAMTPAPDGLAAFSIPGGIMTWNSNAEPGSRWNVLSLPTTLSDGSTVFGVCYTADRWFLAGASDPSLMTGTKTYASVALDGTDEVIYGTFPVSPTHPSISPGGPVCLSDAVLNLPDLDQPMVRIALDGTVTTIVPTKVELSGQPTDIPPSLTWATSLGDHLIVRKPDGFYYMDSKGNGVNMPLLPPINNVVPAGELLFVQLKLNLDHPRAGQWYVLNPTDPQNATFPLPADLTPKKNG